MISTYRKQPDDSFSAFSGSEGSGLSRGVGLCSEFNREPNGIDGLKEVWFKRGNFEYLFGYSLLNRGDAWIESL